MMAMTIFMDSIPAWPVCYVHAVRAGSLSRSRKACFAGMAGNQDSNAVPVHARGLKPLILGKKTDDQRVGQKPPQA
jgi:hypothetical protein